MRVIDETPSPEVVKQAVCRNCGVTLEYVPNDTYTERRTDYTGCTDTYIMIECPKCKSMFTVGIR